MIVSHLVLLGCGHWFIESWDSAVAPHTCTPLRVCAAMDHYPIRYPAVYMPVPEKVPSVDAISVHTRGSK